MPTTKNSPFSSLSAVLFWLLIVIFLIKMADSSTADSSKPAVYIVYTEKPLDVQDVELEAHHTKTLTSVLGSEEAAKEALVYVYKTVANGFSAKLTPEQVAELQKQPGVLQVVPSRTLQLHSGPGRLH